MKHKAILAALAVLSASTFAMKTTFGLGLEASNVHLKTDNGDAAITSAEIDAMTNTAEYAAITGTVTGAAGGLLFSEQTYSTTIAGSKTIFGIKGFASMMMSDRFEVQAGVGVSSGKLALTASRAQQVAIDGQPNAPTVYNMAATITSERKPQYNVFLKALFGFNDAFRFGPEVRFERIKFTDSGKVKVTSDVNNAYLVVDDHTILAGNVGRTETKYGISLEGKINDKLTLGAGYLTAKPKNYQVKMDTAATADLARFKGFNDGSSTVEFPAGDGKSMSLDSYYLDISFKM